MTPSDAINRCLQVIYERWYADKSERLFFRDKRALTKAICRYAYVCNDRGWEFEAMELCKQILHVLVRLDGSKAEYLPVFLEACIDSHVRQRAEEIQEHARKNAQRKFREKAVDEIRKAVVPDSVVVVQKTATEVLAELYKDLSRRSKPERKSGKQMALF